MASSPSVLPLTTLPGESKPYVLESGSGRAHLLIDQVGRALIGAEESGGAWSLLSLEGPKGFPIPLHYHSGDWEYFYCWRGLVQLWTDDESRILNPGDFGFVPAGTVHSYQLHGHHSAFIGPVVPGGWDRFFDLTGIPYSRPAYPVGHEIVIPMDKFAEAEKVFDMQYTPDRAFTPPTTDSPDNTLPGETKPYFLRAGEGPRHLLGGQLQTTILTGAENEGRVSIVTIEAPKGPRFPAHTHRCAHEALFVLDGRLRVWLDGEEHLLTRGDFASIPPGTQHSYQSDAHYTKMLAMSTPAGLERLYAGAGEPTDFHMFTGDAGFDLDRLAEVAKDSDVELAA